jgi:hypothetical protein
MPTKEQTKRIADAMRDSNQGDPHQIPSILYTPPDPPQYVRAETGEYIRLSSIAMLFVGPGSNGKHAVKAESDASIPGVVLAQFDSVREASEALERFMEPISARLDQ